MGHLGNGAARLTTVPSKNEFITYIDCASNAQPFGLDFQCRLFKILLHRIIRKILLFDSLKCSFSKPNLA